MDGDTEDRGAGTGPRRSDPTEPARRWGSGEIPATESLVDGSPADVPAVEEAFRTSDGTVGERERITDSATAEVGGSPGDGGISPTLEPEGRIDHLPIIPGSLRNELGRLFPHLEILEALRKGGMGAVFKARQIRLDRLVALKVIADRPSSDARFAERFLREARTLARMSHSRIVTIYDYGEVRDVVYILMEFVEGPDLRRVLDAGPLEPRRALELTVQICEALEYAHRQGVAHRDLKPANVLLDPRRGAVLADFGLAKILQGEAHDTDLTLSHAILGTPNYMAPEQLSDPRAVDHRADIYALGVVLYEMLTGRRPWGSYEPVSDRLGIDPGIDEILRGALRSDPAERLPTAERFRSLVMSYARDHLAPEAATADRPARGAASPRADAPGTPAPRISVGRIAALGLAVALATAAVHGAGPPFPYRLGERADREIRVNVKEFRIRNQTKTSNERQAAADQVRPAMVSDPGPILELSDRLDDLTVAIAKAARFEELHEAVRASWKLRPEVFAAIKEALATPADRDRLHAQILAAFRPLARDGILGAGALPPSEGPSRNLSVRRKDEPPARARVIPRERVIPETMARAEGPVFQEFCSAFAPPRIGSVLFGLIADKFDSTPTLSFEAEATARAREQARALIPDHYDTYTKGEVLVEQGQTIGEEQLVLLRLEHQARVQSLDRRSVALRLGSILVLVAATYGLLLAAPVRRTGSSSVWAGRPILLCWSISLTLLAIRMFAVLDTHAVVFIFLAFTSLTLGLVFDTDRASAACGVLGLLAAIAVAGRLELLTISVLGSLLGIHALASRQPPNVALAGLVAATGIAFSTWLLGCILDLPSPLFVGDGFWRAGFTFLTGLSLSGLLALFPTRRPDESARIGNRAG